MKSYLEVKLEDGEWFLPDWSYIQTDGSVYWERGSYSGVADSFHWRLSEFGKNAVKTLPEVQPRQPPRPEKSLTGEL